jgi:2'-5' RNA ligase
VTNAPSRRVFFALWPGEEAAGHLSALVQHLTSRGGGRVTPPAALHLTLAFIGAVTPSQIDELECLAAGVHAEAFDLRLDRLGFWPQRGILWAGCRESPPALRRLADRLVVNLRAAGFAIADRQMPHVTLARAARCISLPRLGAPIFWRISEFALVESHLHPSAASYQPLVKFQLAEPNAR